MLELKKRNKECAEEFERAQVKASKDEQDLENEISEGNLKPETIENLEKENLPRGNQQKPKGPLTPLALEAAGGGTGDQGLNPNVSATPLGVIGFALAATQVHHHIFSPVH